MNDAKTKLADRADLKAIAAETMNNGGTYATLASTLNQMRIPPVRAEYWTEHSAYHLCRTHGITSIRPHSNSLGAQTQISISQAKLETLIREAVNANRLTLKQAKRAPVSRVASILGISRYIVAKYRRSVIENIIDNVELLAVEGVA